MTPTKIIVFVLSVISVEQCSAEKYEGERCVDKHSAAPGECCVVHSCRSALDDLRFRRRQPTLCSFVGNTPVVCCRGGCGGGGGGGGGDGTTDATPAVPTEPSRIAHVRKSEMMCAAFGGGVPTTPLLTTPITSSKKKRSKRRRHSTWSNRQCRSTNPERGEQSGGSGGDRGRANGPGDLGDSNGALGNSNGGRGNSDGGETVISIGRGKLNLANIGPNDDSGLVHTAAVGGVNAGLFEFPHMAALGWPKKTGGYAFYCGGSLISDRFVMTAGHCLSNARDTSLASSEPTITRLGDQNILDSIVDGAQPSDVPIDAVFRHKLYRPPVKYYDIALLRMKTAVRFSEHVRPACLWTEPDFGNYTTAIVTGWGTTTSGGRENSAELQKVQVDILETSVCQPLLQSAWNRNWRGFSEHQLCAGVLAGGKDACQGDSGGPLQVRDPGGNYHIIGVTAFGRECGKRNQPGVYTRVSAFIDWIESVVWPTEA